MSLGVLSGRPGASCLTWKNISAHHITRDILPVLLKNTQSTKTLHRHGVPCPWIWIAVILYSPRQPLWASPLSGPSPGTAESSFHAIAAHSPGMLTSTGTSGQLGLHFWKVPWYMRDSVLNYPTMRSWDTVSLHRMAHLGLSGAWHVRVGRELRDLLAISPTAPGIFKIGKIVDMYTPQSL